VDLRDIEEIAALCPDGTCENLAFFFFFFFFNLRRIIIPMGTEEGLLRQI
jgi:hypothetical protein